MAPALRKPEPKLDGNWELEVEFILLFLTSKPGDDLVYMAFTELAHNSSYCRCPSLPLYSIS